MRSFPTLTTRRGPGPTLRLVLVALGAASVVAASSLAACTGSSGEPATATATAGLETMGSVSYGLDTGTFFWDGQPIGTLACRTWDDPRMEGTLAERVAFLEEQCELTLAPESALPADPCDAAGASFSIAADGSSYAIDKCESLDGQDPYTGAEAVWHQVPDWSTSYDAECFVEQATGDGCCNFYVDIDPAELSACDAVYPGLRAPPPPPGDGGGSGSGSGSDAGPGSGSDAGSGSGSDAGPGSGSDAGPGSGSDAGPGSGSDAGPGSGSDAGTGPGSGSDWGSGSGGNGYGALTPAALMAMTMADPVPPGPTQPGPPPPVPNQRANVFMQWVAAILLSAGTYVTPFNPELGRQLVRTADRVVRLIEAMRRGNNRQVPKGGAQAVPGAPPDPPPPGTERRLEERGGRRPPPPRTPPRPPQMLPPGGRPIPKPEMLPHPPVRPPLRPPIG